MVETLAYYQLESRYNGVWRPVGIFAMESRLFPQFLEQDKGDRPNPNRRFRRVEPVGVPDLIYDGTTVQSYKGDSHVS